MIRAVVLLTIALLVCGIQCPINNGPVCTEIFVYGVNVALTDAQTGQPVRGATLILTDGAYTETMQEITDGHYAGAGERPGTYGLSIEAEGYAPQTRSMIVVKADECHAIPVNLDIQLTSAS